MKFFPLIFLFLIGSLGCSESAPPQPAETAAAPASADEPPALVTRRAFFDNPVRSQGRISPDGKWLSWLAPHEGVMNIWVAPSDDPEAARVVTKEIERGVPVHYWAHNSEIVLYNQDQGGNENYHIYAVNLTSGDITDLTPVADGARATLLGRSKDHPDHIAVGLNDRNPQLFDVYRVNVRSGERTLVAENPGYPGWEVDNDLEPRLAWEQLPGGARNLLKLTEDGTEVVAEFGVQDVMNSFAITFNGDNTHLYMVDSRDRNTAALVKMDVATGEFTTLAEDPRADISDVLYNRVTGEIDAYASEFLRVEWRGLTDSFAASLADMQQQIPGDLNFVARSNDGNKLVIAADAPEKPGVYYIYDVAQKTATEMFATRPALADVSLQPMQALELKSRDGLSLTTYLTLPAGADADGDGIPETPQSMVLMVHGGPWARDSYGYNTVHQWLSDRGHAVMSVNYRGSTGFGKEFLNAAKKEFAGKMHDDLIDAVDWARENKIADDVAIMGGSYGGYATLVGVTFTPDTFACGVDIVGPSNLITLIESFPDYWRPSLEANWYAFVGDPADEAERADMYNRSPIARVADIKVPLLIGQGENDPRVTKAESDQIVAAMDERGLPVTYLNYPDEGHGFARPENRMSFFATTEAFLSSCLGGRYEPIGEDFAGSSVEVLHGADYVPGLVDQIAGDTTGG